MPLEALMEIKEAATEEYVHANSFYLRAREGLTVYGLNGD